MLNAAIVVGAELTEKSAAAGPVIFTDAIVSVLVVPKFSTVNVVCNNVLTGELAA